MIKAGKMKLIGTGLEKRQNLAGLGLEPEVELVRAG